ncbi:hypothetical protein Cni_G22174 [Canna indica]|uniref:Uncharacterized protein n=1 Tax=Canna indica TaxID=4628 RepID=A0AAQ3KRE8_9LILI|nr:hypothetical protein Cni_G22174 [Canna indica]
MNDPSQLLNRGFGMWQPPSPPQTEDPMGFPNSARPPLPFAAPPAGVMPGRMNWKAKKAADKRKKAAVAAAGGGVGPMVGGVLPSAAPAPAATNRRPFTSCRSRTASRLAGSTQRRNSSATPPSAPGTRPPSSSAPRNPEGSLLWSPHAP